MYAAGLARDEAEADNQEDEGDWECEVRTRNGIEGG